MKCKSLCVMLVNYYIQKYRLNVCLRSNLNGVRAPLKQSKKEKKKTKNSRKTHMSKNRNENKNTRKMEGNKKRKMKKKIYNVKFEHEMKCFRIEYYRIQTNSSLPKCTYIIRKVSMRKKMSFPLRFDFLLLILL